MAGCSPGPPKRLGPSKGLVPLKAVIQHKHKVYPVMDYRELIEYADAFAAHTDACKAKLRELAQRRCKCITIGFEESMSSDLH